MTQYQIRQVAGSEIIAAARLSFPALPRSDRQARQVIQAAPTELGIDFHHQTVAIGPRGLAASCLSVIMAGRGATVISPQFTPSTPQSDHQHLAVRLISAAIDHCRLSGAVLIQSLLDPSPQHDRPNWFTQAGFSYLASLIYMQRPADQPADTTAQAEIDTWQWTTYADHDEETIGRLIELTYAETLDCPELENIRSWRDVIDSHKASGKFDPRGWSIAAHNGQLAGLALVNQMTSRNACELVYMGVAPAFRGRRLGRLLVQRALAATRLLNSPILTLAVDTRNEPALAVYRQAGFADVATRDAYFVKPAP